MLQLFAVCWNVSRIANEKQSARAETYCNTLQHTGGMEVGGGSSACEHRGTVGGDAAGTLQHTATHCNTPQHTATHSSILQHAKTHCNTLQDTAPCCNTLQYTTKNYNTLHHAATHCTTLQHIATYCNTLQQTVAH